MQKKEITFIISSDVLNGATNKSADGSTFDVQLEQPLQIPANASNVTLEVQTATIWWTVPNILTGVNDKFRLKEPLVNAGAFTDVIIPQGLYDLVGLAAAIEREIVDAGYTAGMFTFSGDTATQKVVIAFNIANSEIDFTATETFRGILGFDSQVLANVAVLGKTFLAENVANFNVLEYFLMTTDLVDAGLRFNNTWNQIMARVYVDVAPGSQIVYTPQWPAKSGCNKLRGRAVQTMHFTLTDQNNNLVNTAGEDYSAEIVIKYDLPIKKGLVF